MKQPPKLINMEILPNGNVIYKGKELKPICLTINMIRENKKVKE